MLLVVFGAGASYDSDPDHRPDPNPYSGVEQDRPPLANHLFDSRPHFLDAMDAFPECRPLIPQLRKPGIAVEKELARIQNEAASYPLRHRQIAAIRYYLRKAIWDCQNRWNSRHRQITNYSTFIDEIERWRVETNEGVCFVTFNYDTMLEDAMGQVLRLEVQDMASYTRKNYPLFKLHGSVNWGRVVHDVWAELGAPPSRFYKHLINTVNLDGGNISAQYRLCDIEMRPRAADPREVLYPALSIPVEKKDEFSCPSEHVRALTEALPHVSKIITVGWRATEAEFLNMLKASRSVPISGIRQSVNLLVVTGSAEGAEETRRNIFEHIGQEQEVDPHPDRDNMTTGFSGLIDNLPKLAQFLRGEV